MSHGIEVLGTMQSSALGFVAPQYLKLGANPRRREAPALQFPWPQAPSVPKRTPPCGTQVPQRLLMRPAGAKAKCLASRGESPGAAGVKGKALPA